MYLLQYFYQLITLIIIHSGCRLIQQKKLWLGCNRPGNL